MEKLYTPQEVADELKIKKHTVYDMIKRGELGSAKIGKQLRISSSQLTQYLKLSGTVKKSIPSSSPYPENALLKNDYLTHQSGLVICGQDIVLDLLCAGIESHPHGLPTLRSRMGSYNSLYSLYFNKIHMAIIHLWDSMNQTYNLPYIHRMLPGTPVTVIRLFNRKIGFYVQKGNPKGITSFSDLSHSNVIFTNRELGSGTRVLLDEHLALCQMTGSQIKGYQDEVLSPIAAASQVASGNTDVAMGHEAILESFPMLDFVPIQEESYDLVFRKNILSPDTNDMLVNIITSSNFKKQLSFLPGYDFNQLGKIIE